MQIKQSEQVPFFIQTNLRPQVVINVEHNMRRMIELWKMLS